MLRHFSRIFRLNVVLTCKATSEGKIIKYLFSEKNLALSLQRTKFPEDPIVQFKSIKNKLAAPFVVYADFESILHAYEHKNKIQEHHACSYAYHIVSNIPGVEFEPRLYVGLDAAEHLLESLQNDFTKHIKPWIENEVEMLWDEDAQEKFESATHCHMCEEEFQPSMQHDHKDGETEEECDLCIHNSKMKRVRDHNHFTGIFRGAAHNYCNLQYKIEKQRYKLPVIFHNLRGYDSHLIFKQVKPKHGHIDVIANTSERYISFSIGQLKFLDSMQFLSGSLDKLSAQLKPEQFHHFKKVYPNDTERALLTKKGVYPYSYMNIMARFGETSLDDDSFFMMICKTNLSKSSKYGFF